MTSEVLRNGCKTLLIFQKVKKRKEYFLVKYYDEANFLGFPIALKRNKHLFDLNNEIIFFIICLAMSSLHQWIE